MKTIKQISLGLLCLSASGVNAQWTQMPTTGITGNNIVLNQTPPVVKVVDGGIEKTIFMNSDGLFEYNPSTQSWSRYGAGLEGIGIRSLSVGSIGKFALSTNGLLFKFDQVGSKWDTVIADVPNTDKDFGKVGSINDGIVYQYTQKGKNRLFVTSFNNDITAGLIYSDDMGTTWKNYNRITNVIGDTGLYIKSGSSTIVTRFITEDSEGRLYLSSKATIAISNDGGDNWVSRIGNYSIDKDQGNIRSMIIYNFEGTEYLVIGTDNGSASSPTIGTSVVGDNVGINWTSNQNIKWGEANPVNLSAYAGKYLFAIQRSGGRFPKVSTDNNLSDWSEFSSNLPSISSNSDNRTAAMSVAGDSLYLTIGTGSTAPNGLYVFNLSNLDAPKAQFQISDNEFGDPISGAVLEINGRTITTDNAGIATVFGIKDSTDVPIKITKTGFVTIDSVITFTTANPIAIQMGLITSLDSYRTTESTLYPNPASDLVYLPAGAQNVTVMSASGAPMNVQITGRSLNISGLNPGMYIVRSSLGIYKFMKK